jgi:hypothetical protein
MNLKHVAVFLSFALSATLAVSAQTYLGFDRNQYPGDANLQILRRTFAFSGYWLNNPPGEANNTWRGKRQVVRAAGFGFLLLFNGRLEGELKNPVRAEKLGRSDAAAAVASAKKEGFPVNAIIFLDQEQGGRMLPDQRAYIYAWVDGVADAGFRAGIYCSGIASQESPGVSIVTAEDIRHHAGGRKIAYFVTNDACPPSFGCAFPQPAPKPSRSGIDFAEIWQFAQSPKRPDFAAGCPANYDRDGSCHPPGVQREQGLHVDVETATSRDPSAGR